MPVLGLYNYWIAIAIMMIGFYGVVSKFNMIKQAIALGLFQTGVFLLYVTMAVYRSEDGTSGRAPIWEAIGDGSVKHPGPYDNPLPHVLMLTAIVVSVSTLAVAIAIIMNIKKRYGTIEADEVLTLEGDPDTAAASDRLFRPGRPNPADVVVRAGLAGITPDLDIPELDAPSEEH